MRRYLPREHGAWAMLLVPYIVGVIVGGPAWVHIPLLVAWLAGYLLSYYCFLTIKTRRFARQRPQVWLYATITLPAALATVALRPALLAFAPAYLALSAVNAWYAWKRRQRAMVNDLASVVQACLMVPLAVVAASGSLGDSLGAAVRPFLAVLLYFAGTVFYVKTMIRERDNPAYLRASVGYHAAAVPAAAVIAWPLTPLFGWFLVRAILFPRRRRRPLQVGLVEIANSVALIVAIALALR